MYNISSYSFSKAKSLNVDIKPSTKKNKKIDVYKNNKYICSIGDSRYSDYPTYLTTHNKEYADKRKALYHLRHQKEKDKLNTAGYYAYHILW
jgi:hypothetical protein